MNYLDQIFDNAGQAAVDASERYLEGLVDNVGTKEAPIKEVSSIAAVVEPKNYSGLIFIGVGLAAIIGAVLLFKKGKK